MCGNRATPNHRLQAPDAPDVFLRQATERLRLFNEKVDDYRSFRAVRRLLRGGAINYSVIVVDSATGMEVVSDGPDSEDTAAVTLVVRFFIQERDGIKIEQIHELYEELPVTQELREAFDGEVEDLNRYLDSITYEFNEVPYSQRDIFEVVAYGGIAHMNRDKRELLLGWQASPVQWPLAWSAFNSTLRKLIKSSFVIYDLNERALTQLAQPS